MFRYAARRVSRGRSMFIALFLSVTIAVTLFSGMLQGADAVGTAMLDRVFMASDVDIVSGAENRNLTKTALVEVEEAIKVVQQVKWTERLVRSKPEAVNIIKGNISTPFIFVTLSKDSRLMPGISGVDQLERGKLYIERDSNNASLYDPDDEISLKIITHDPYGSFMDIAPRFSNHAVGGFVELDDRVFSMLMGTYPNYLIALLGGTSTSEGRAPHNLVIMSEETLWDILNPIYNERRQPSWTLIVEVIIGLERGALVTLWDIQGASKAVGLINERINSIGARYGYVPVNYLGELLGWIEASSTNMKASTLSVILPIFFIAWYLGVTVSDVTLGLRRREIGLLFTRGLTHRQVFLIFMFEALLVSVLAGLTGVVAGALVTPLVVSGLSPWQVLGSISPVSIAASLLFSGTLSLLVVYRPARNAARVEVVEALREYHSEEETPISWQEPLLALVLGGYKLAMFILGVDVESFRPATENVAISLLYSTWWGVDYLLTHIGLLLFFWGATKLVIQYFGWFDSFLRRVAALISGDVAVFSTISGRRHLRRTVASTFMIALIFGYGLVIIGTTESTRDLNERYMKQVVVGADAVILLFSQKGAGELSSRVENVSGVSVATVETWFTSEDVPIRAIEPLKWKDVAYMDPGWLEGQNPFEKMNASETAVMLERGAAEQLGKKLNDTFLIKLGSDVYSCTVVGIFGRDLGARWSLQDPTVYVPDSFLKEVGEEAIAHTRILAKLEKGADAAKVTESVKKLDRNIGAVYIAERQIQIALNNPYVAGPRHIEELGIYFSALMSSIGVALVVATMLRSRQSEINIMSIRGFSSRQLKSSFVVESLGVAAFAIALGLAVGFIYLRGEIGMMNSITSSPIPSRLLITSSMMISLAAVAVVIIASAVAPIPVIVKRILNKPSLRIEV